MPPLWAYPDESIDMWIRFHLFSIIPGASYLRLALRLSSQSKSLVGFGLWRVRMHVDLINAWEDVIKIYASKVIDLATWRYISCEEISWLQWWSLGCGSNRIIWSDCRILSASCPFSSFCFLKRNAWGDTTPQDHSTGHLL